jgi:radical SAM protein with 4Fe4S-binding SPASM domain
MNPRQTYNLFKAALKYPRISLEKISRFAERAGPVPVFPRLLRFFLFYGCNLRCRMCGQWGDFGTSRAADVHRFISLEKLVRLLEEARPHHPEIYLWGGEPTLHPDFAAFVHEIKTRKLTCTVNTNGLLLEKHAQTFLENRVDSIDVSLLGTESVHDLIVQTPGSYRQVMRGLAALNRGKRRPLIKAVVTLSEHNLEAIENLLTDIEMNPAIDLSILQLGWFVPTPAGEKYRERMQKEFETKAESWLGFRDDQAATKIDKIKNLWIKIQNNPVFKKPILLFPDMTPEQITPYFADHGDLLNRSRCGALYRELDIRPNGEVVACGDFPDYILGHVHDQSLQEIWRGDKIRKLRESIVQNGLLPVCNRCCGLFR